MPKGKRTKPETAVLEVIEESDEIASPQRVVSHLSGRGFDEAAVSRAILQLLDDQKLILRWDRQLELPSRLRKELEDMTTMATAVQQAIGQGAPNQAVQQAKRLASIAGAQKWSDLANGQEWQKLADSIGQMERVGFRLAQADKLADIASTLGDVISRLAVLTRPAGAATHEGPRPASTEVTAQSAKRVTRDKATAGARSKSETNVRARATSSETASSGKRATGVRASRRRSTSSSTR
jgi:hypothetical protein